MVPKSFPTVATPAPDGGGAVRNNAPASIQSEPETVVLMLAGAQGEYGVSIYLVIITSMSTKTCCFSHFTQ